jgi:hypothetical protein
MKEGVMKKTLVIRVCEHFYKEVSEVLQRISFPNVTCIAYPARCGKPPVEPGELFLETPAYQVILGSCCLSNLKHCESIPDCEVILLETCFQMIAPGAVIEYLIAQKSFITSPGWLSHWREHVKDWGDKTAMRCMFRETISNIIMFDTGIYLDTSDELRKFADYLEIPFNSIPIGLDHCRLYISDILYRWHDKNENNMLAVALDSSQRELADHAMALDLLGKIPVLDSRDAVFQNMADVLTQLFAPEYIHGLSYVDGFPESFRTTQQDEFDRDEAWNRLAEYEGEGLTEDQKGFFFPVRDKDDILLMLEINRCAMPNDIPHYINLCDLINGVLALSVSNARIYVKLQEALDNVDTLRGIIPICSHCKQIRTDQGAWEQIERYVSTHSLAEFSHSICPTCMDKYYPEVAEKMRKKKEGVKQ